MSSYDDTRPKITKRVPENEIIRILTTLRKKQHDQKIRNGFFGNIVANYILQDK